MADPDKELEIARRTGGRSTANRGTDTRATKRHGSHAGKGQRAPATPAPRKAQRHVDDEHLTRRAPTKSARIRRGPGQPTVGDWMRQIDGQLSALAPGSDEWSRLVSVKKGLWAQQAYRFQDWPLSDFREAYAVRRLTDYGFTANAAAGIVGNLIVESGVIPSRIESSLPGTPMTAPALAGGKKTFSGEEVRERSVKQKLGPLKPGIGIAQWTTEPRRSKLFSHVYEGRRLGTQILDDVDAQIDYLVTELNTTERRVGRALKKSGISLEEASDEVVYNFERPDAVLGRRPKGKKTRPRKPKTDPTVQKVFAERRGKSRGAHTLFLEFSKVSLP